MERRGGADGGVCVAALASARSDRPHGGLQQDDVLIAVEVDSIDELREALDAGATRILLDNFSNDDLTEAVSINSSYGYVAAELEASGNVTLDNIRDVAETGVDYISVGALTKNIEAVDLSMLFRID